MAMLLQRPLGLLKLSRACQTVRALTAKSFESYVTENEPMLQYGPGSSERQQLEEALERYSQQTWEVPICIGDQEITTQDVHYQVEPFDHQKKLAKFYYATPEIIKKGIESCLAAQEQWEKMPIYERANIFLQAAELMSSKYRMDLMATTMLGQAKNIWQAEIDATAELIDFLRFNVMYASQLMNFQLLNPNPANKNTMVFRGIEGFWAAISPFNFTAIGGHLPAAPALMGNCAVWKPSDTALLSNYTVYKIYREAGLPPGVINFIPADGPVFGDIITSSPHLAGINFTGSVRTFKHLMKKISENIDVYKSYPRLIGECGGKNMHFVHSSADLETVVNCTIRAAFEYNGQKCSACSRMYVPQSMWPKLREELLNVHKEIHMGSPFEKNSLVTAVIDDKAFSRIKSYIDYAKSSPNLKILAGGKCDDSKGYFIEPTILETTDPSDRIMQEEIFGPVMTIYPYPDEEWRKMAKFADHTSPYALTGAIFARDEQAKDELVQILRHAAGNFYINNKSTGSVVGQQPFGGARLSGTNDKAGGPHYLLKFACIQSRLETYPPIQDWRYPSMDE